MEVDESNIDFTIEELTIDKNNIHYLNFLHKFKNLRKLYCGNNNLTSLPELPTTLINLYCSYNNLTNLPELPNTLTQLYCGYNNLTSLPELPTTLTELYCGYNNLTNLPELSNNLIHLNCSYNKLNSLPELPNSLTYLNYSFNNKLLKLPILQEYLNYRKLNLQYIIKLNKARVKHHHSPFITEFMSTRFKILMSPSRISRLMDSGYLALDSQSGWDDI